MTIQSKRFLVASFLLSILITSLSTANAHSRLMNSDPSSGQILDQISQVMTLTFNEDLIEIEGEQVNTLQLNYVDSGEDSALEVSIAGPDIVGSVPAGTYPSGKYELSYRVVSADGHPISGVIPFSTYEVTTISQPERRSFRCEGLIANYPALKFTSTEFINLHRPTLIDGGEVFSSSEPHGSKKCDVRDCRTWCAKSSEDLFAPWICSLFN